MPHVDIVFAGPPDHQGARFVEVEDEHGNSIRFGKWVARSDGYWALRLELPILGIEEDSERAGPTFVPTTTLVPVPRREEIASTQIVVGVIAVEGRVVAGGRGSVYSREAVQALDGSMGGKVHVRINADGKLEAVYSGPAGNLPRREAVDGTEEG